MRVLTDYHHGGLYNSMHLLAKRIGWELFRPIGLDWFTNGFWRVAEPYGNAQDTINQYLAIDDRPYIPYVNLNGGHKKSNDVYEIWDPENLITHKAITFTTFKDMQFDLIIATHPLHETWMNLLKYQPKAKFIMQLGNEGQVTTAKNAFSSVWQYHPQPDQNVFYYHQEFQLDDFGWTVPVHRNVTSSFVHLLPHPEIFDLYRNNLPEITFRSYGMQCRDGIPSSKKEMAQLMKSSSFGWHIKSADGYGHLIHQWYACGRPLITKGNYYSGKTGGLLLTDQETCIDLDKHSVKENVDLIRFWSQPDNHDKMCRNAFQRFQSVVNFDSEASRLQDWIHTII